MGILSPYYDASFDGIDFWEQDQGSGTRPGAPLTQSDTLYHVPGSDTNILIDMGQAASEFTLVAAVEGAELSSLLGAVGSSGSLVFSRGTTTARLRALEDNPGKAGALDAYTVSLKFVVL